ncbi:MAG: MarR family transcriptional regulator [Acidobacteriota bacterium]|nr:MarR family transcriptional regulator [Acidobacteriota bacterium]
MKRSQARWKAPFSFDRNGGSPEVRTAQAWRKDLLISWLFQTCIKLQTSLDHRFLRHGVTVQEASVLLRCAEAHKITPGKLAVILGRDKGNVTRIVDRLEGSGLVTRETFRRDRRYSIIEPTRKGKQLAAKLGFVFDSIRTELFLGIKDADVLRLGAMLPQLHDNTSRINPEQEDGPVRRRRRIGSNVPKNEITPKKKAGLAKGTRISQPEAYVGDVLSDQRDVMTNR